MWTVAVVLVVFWMAGLMSGYTVGNFIHILLFFAITAMLIQIEDDCSNYGSGRMRKRYLKRQSVSSSRKILPMILIILLLMGGI